MQNVVVAVVFLPKRHIATKERWNKIFYFKVAMAIINNRLKKRWF